jgi:hypothetical protein
MAKRYHQTREDRRHEREGMHRSMGEYVQDRQDRRDESRGMLRRMNEGFYTGYHDRRREEMRDAGMIHEDHREIANLPQQVMMKPWPDAGGYEPEVLDDTIRGINEQKSADHSKMMKHFHPHKY